VAYVFVMPFILECLNKIIVLIGKIAVDDAMVIGEDLAVTNGVIHVIDTVLLPHANV